MAVVKKNLITHKAPDIMIKIRFVLIKSVIFILFVLSQSAVAQRFIVIDTFPSNYPKRIFSIPYETAQSILADSNTTNLIGRFVVQESKRYRMALHPVFAKLDSVAPPGSAKRAALEANPYTIFPKLEEYKYNVKWSITPMHAGYFTGDPDKQLALQNIYVVYLQECLSFPGDPLLPPPPRIVRPDSMDNNGEFIVVEEWNPPKRLPDSFCLCQLGRRVDCLRYYTPPTFFANDGIFAVYYCKETGDLRMVGGHAFLEQFPQGAFNFTSERTTNFNAGIVAMTRLVHLSCKEKSCRNSNYKLIWPAFYEEPERIFGGYWPSSIYRYEYRYRECSYYHDCGRCYNDIVRITNGFPPVDSIPSAHRLRSDVSHYSSYDDEHNKQYPIVRLPERPWGVSTRYYVRKPSTMLRPYYQDGFPYYEVTYTIIDQPERYEDVLPKVRGLTEAEFAAIKAKRRVALNE
jgi:hypothetical protein